MACISGLDPCFDFIPLILVVSCSFSCYSFVNSFLSSAGFLIDYKVPWKTIQCLSTIRELFGIQLEVISSAQLTFLAQGLQHIIGEQLMGP